ncbi:MAG: helix-turn-helix domain-containing protein [Novosphingobium sp.]
MAVALILDGVSRSEAAKIAGVTLQIVRDWVLRFNERGPDGLATRKVPGRGFDPERRAARPACRDRRGGTNSCSAWGSALAAVRSVPPKARPPVSACPVATVRR